MAARWNGARGSVAVKSDLPLNVEASCSVETFLFLHHSNVNIAFLGNQEECGSSEDLLPFMSVWQNESILELDLTSTLSCRRQFSTHLSSLNHNKGIWYNL